MAFITLLSLQMCHLYAAIIGLLVSLAAIFVGISVLSYYSIKKFSTENNIPQNTEALIIVAIVNLGILWLYLICSPIGLAVW